jgi:glycosyltransferase involved in cell wall biosynthesis
VITGHVPYEKIPEYLSAIDVFIAPYPHIEPFYFSPLKIIEAMAAGKPVLASAQGQISELIQDGVNGCLFPPGHKEIFLEKLKLLGENKEIREKMGANARKTIAEKYTWNNNAAKVFDLCRRFQ